MGAPFDRGLSAAAGVAETLNLSGAIGGDRQTSIAALAAMLKGCDGTLTKVRPGPSLVTPRVCAR